MTVENAADGQELKVVREWIFPLGLLCGERTAGNHVADVKADKALIALGISAYQSSSM
jgi:hypothetical protein